MENLSATTKAMGLLAQVAKGLLAHSNHETQTQLGDRKSYIGMSDIGKATECLRAAVAGKVKGNMLPVASDIGTWFGNQQYDKIREALKKQLVLQRGHWLEAGIMDAFKANGTNIIPQLEIDIVHDGVPIKPHLDFVLVWGKPRPAVRILELKSTEKIPRNLYSSYETQVYGQLGFLHKYWAQPCFRIKDVNGTSLYEKLTFPELAKKLFNVDMPVNPDHVDIEGWVLCLAMSDFKAFGPYKPCSTMLKMCEGIAKDIWQQTAQVNNGKLDLNAVDYCREFHPLCDWCSHAGTCPKFTLVELTNPTYMEMLDEHEQLKQQRDELKDEISLRERRISDFYLRSGLRKEWLTTGPFKFKSSMIKGRNSLDNQLLLQELNNTLGEEQANQLIQRCTKQGSPYRRLQISKQKS